MVEIIERRRRVEHEARLAAVLLDEPYGAVDVFGRLGMERNDVRAGFGEIGNDAIDRLYH